MYTVSKDIVALDDAAVTALVYQADQVVSVALDYARQVRDTAAARILRRIDPDLGVVTGSVMYEPDAGRQVMFEVAYDRAGQLMPPGTFDAIDDQNALAEAADLLAESYREDGVFTLDINGLHGDRPIGIKGAAYTAMQLRHYPRVHNNGEEEYDDDTPRLVLTVYGVDVDVTPPLHDGDPVVVHINGEESKAPVHVEWRDVAEANPHV